jgi:glycosyltransferase involved in cell wall biosynthesis
MSGAEPIVSVVIVTSRPIRLAFALDALREQTIGTNRFEVVVVRDPSSAGPLEDPPGDLDCRVLVEGTGANIASLRNAGWQSARAPFVAFTDDDCRPSPEWLERALAEAAPGVIVQGRTEPDPDELHLLHGLARTQFIREESPWLQTCNIVYPRAMLEALGGFDEEFAQIGEDADLGARAVEAGASVRFVAEALAWHAVVPRTLPRAIREAARRDTLPLLVRRHPSLRRALRAGLFIKPSHGLWTLGLAGSLLAPDRLLRAAAWAPYVAYHVNPSEVRGPRRAIHALMTAAARGIVDGVEVATTARGALEERTPVL